MFSLFAKQKPAFGLDISDNSLRAMLLSSTKEGFFPVAYADTHLNTGIVHDGEVKNPDKLAELIDHTRKHPTSGVIDTPYVVLSVPESKSFVRVINVPRMSEDEAKEAVPFEAEQYIPVPSDQVYLDFKILPGAPGLENDKMRVLITASPRALIDQYVDVVKKAGCIPVGIEVESEAVARCLISPDLRTDTVLLLDISTTRTSLIIHDEGSLQFTSSLPVAGNAFTTQISQAKTINFEEAEKLKIQAGLDTRKDGGSIQKILEPQVQALTEAIRNTINFYREHSDGRRAAQYILLTGGGSKLRGLDITLNQRLQDLSPDKKRRFVQQGDPWINVLKPPIKRVPPIPKAESISYSTAVGLALRGINLK